MAEESHPFQQALCGYETRDRCQREKWESADKPGSVEDDHSSGTPVTERLVRPTRRHLRAAGCPMACLPIWSCSRGGLPCRLRYRRRGALLPHPFTLTCRRRTDAIGGLLSVALSVGSRRPGVTWPLALWSPDFPRPPNGDRDRLADSTPQIKARPCRPQATDQSLATDLQGALIE